MATDKIFTLPVRVYYEDTDFSGIVYHANYLKFFERGRSDALRQCGVTHTDLLAREQPLVFAVRKMTTEWLAPARIDDDLQVRTQYKAVRGARIALAQEIWRHEDRLACADVEAVCLTADGAPRRVPADILEQLS